MRHYRFQLLLAALFIMILALPLIPILGDWSRYVTSLTFSLMLITAVFAVAEKKVTGVVVFGLFGISLLIEIIEVWHDPAWLLCTDYIVSIVFLSGVIFIIAKSLFRPGEIKLDTICAALSVYLLIALLFSVLYALVELGDPNAFAFNTAIRDYGPSMQSARERSIIPLYYSLVTITTLGYGDISPVSPAAATLAVVEAVIGQFYLTVLVAWLVGMYISSTMQAKRN